MEELKVHVGVGTPDPCVAACGGTTRPEPAGGLRPRSDLAACTARCTIPPVAPTHTSWPALGCHSFASHSRGRELTFDWDFNLPLGCDEQLYFYHNSHGVIQCLLHLFIFKKILIFIHLEELQTEKKK